MFQGQLIRTDRVQCSQAFDAFDHDFPSWGFSLISSILLLYDASRLSYLMILQ